MWRKLCWYLIMLAYWAIVVQTLRSASPVSFDIGGPSSGFYWGTEPSPGLSEYYRHRSYFELLYLLPYLVAGLLATVIGCGVAPLLVRRSGSLSVFPFAGTATVTLALLVLLALSSDLGIRLELWIGPLFFLHGDITPYHLVVLSKVLLFPSLLAGLAAVIRRL